MMLDIDTTKMKSVGKKVRIVTQTDLRNAAGEIPYLFLKAVEK